MDPGLNQLLQWGIENSNSSQTDANGRQAATEPRGLSSDALRALMGGPSEADLMKEAMSIIVSPDPSISLDSKLTAFDNFEQMVENIDNANNLQPLGLWTPLVAQLDSPEADLRRMAAWCIGTAVQNNDKAQERFLAMNGMATLCRVAVEDGDPAVRRKAIYALSSEVRNYQPGMTEAVKYLPKDIVGSDQVFASDMDTVDAIMTKLREKK